MSDKKHNHYFKSVAHLEWIDIYRVIDLYAITDPCLQHAFKKISCAGGRGVKDTAKDVQEAIDSLLRYQEMQRENHGEDKLEKVTSLNVDLSAVCALAENFEAANWGLENFTNRPEPSKLGDASNVIRPAAEIPHVESEQQWTEDKELASSGIYGNNGYTQKDMAAADVCCAEKVFNNEDKQTKCDAKTLKEEAESAQEKATCEARKGGVSMSDEIAADVDGWIERTGSICPTNCERMVFTKSVGWDSGKAAKTGRFFWSQSIGQDVIAHWKFAD